MRLTTPVVRLIARPEVDWPAMRDYLLGVGGESWLDNKETALEPVNDGETLAEFSGRLCYRSWKPGLNPNVTKVREDPAAYLRNILASGHGSVLEHLNYTFVFSGVSRVLTHELVRHRAGTAISQESMRYVRLDDIPVWLPDWAREDDDLLSAIDEEVRRAEAFQQWMSERYELDADDVPFHHKKAVTSFMRRFAPGGVSTDLVWTANVRALRHIIETRTAHGAEEEIRLVFGQVAEIMKDAAPLLFGDFHRDGHGAYVPEWRKV